MGMKLLLWGVTVAFAGVAPAQMLDLRAEASMVSDVAAVSPGQSFTVGLRLRMPKDAYVYWRNPGDAGLPTTLRWTLPEGFTAGDIQWPVPGIFDEPPLRSFGYKEEVILPVRFQVAGDWEPQDADRVEIGLRADWLICREACVPGSAELTLTLRVAEHAEADPAGARLIAAFRDRLPETNTGWSGTVRLDGDGVVLAFRVPEGAVLTDRAGFFFLPYTEELIEPASDPRVRREDGHIVLTVSRDVMRGEPEARLRGILLIREQGSATRAVEVELTRETPS